MGGTIPVNEETGSRNLEIRGEVGVVSVPTSPYDPSTSHLCPSTPKFRVGSVKDGTLDPVNVRRCPESKG